MACVAVSCRVRVRTMDVGTSGLLRISLLNLPGLVGDKYMIVMINLVGTSCLCYNNNIIPKI